jgi:arsenite methyltransferase
MNRNNALMNAFAIQQLSAGESDRILEIGFGGGVMLPDLIRRAHFVEGVDRSRLMVDRATRRFAEAVAAGRAGFQVGRVEALPFDAGSFDKLCTVNTVYFWRSLEEGFNEMHRVLRAGGRAVVGFLPKEWMDRMDFPPDIFTPRTTIDVIAALRLAGFEDIVVQRPAPSTRWQVVVSTCGRMRRPAETCANN